MSPSTRIRLSFMMFLQYFVWGTWYVTMFTYLSQTRGFTGGQIGWAYAAVNIGAIVAPFFVGMIADRFFATEKILAVLHILGGGFLYWASTATTFPEFLSALLCHTLCYMPTMALTNSLSFHHVSNPGKDFPFIRVLGTIGWIAAGWLIGYQAIWGKSIEPTDLPFKIGAASSVAMGLFCLCLPHTPPKAKGLKVDVKTVLGLDALQLLKDRSFLIFIVGSLLICIPLAFYFSGANGFLNEIGVTNAASKMTFGQMSEIIFMLVMPFFFSRLGVKKMLLCGMLAWTARYVLFMFGNPGSGMWMLYGGIVLHGICYDFFFVTGQIYVDRQANISIRAAAQGFIAFITYGLGMMIGSLVQGKVAETYAINNTSHHWDKIWLIPAVMSGAVFLLFALFFKESDAAKGKSAIHEAM
ncbi:MAG: yegT 2 [Verrucomicrobiales bacterium]|nr:yegT 2 [Verrucomicrobiales bacterium]